MSLIAGWLGCAAPPAPPPEPWFTRRDGEPAASRPPPPGARSVVLVVGCTVRADQTGPYASLDPDPTPFLSALAAEGTVYDDVLTAAPWTRPAVTALLTGRPAAAVGMTDPGPGRDDRRLPAEVVTLAEHLAVRGWTTVGVAANPNVHHRFGLDQGFARWREVAPWRSDAGVKLPGTAVVAEVSDALRGLPDGPALVVVVLVDAHAPLDGVGAERFAGPEVPTRLASYRAALSRFDAATGQIVSLARAALGDPIVAVVSDHGEGLSLPAAHGPGHGRFLTPSTTRGVWVVAGPGVAPGARVPELVSQIDVAPTLAALAGAPYPDAEGRDRRPGGRPDPDRRAFTDTWFLDTDRAAIVTPTRACAIDLSGLPPEDGFVDGCFDRRLDPSWTRPLADPALVDELLRWRATHVRAGEPAGVEPGLDEALEALGYADP